MAAELVHRRMCRMAACIHNNTGVYECGQARAVPQTHCQVSRSDMFCAIEERAKNTDKLISLIIIIFFNFFFQRDIRLYLVLD